MTRVMMDEAGALRPWKRIYGIFRIIGTNPIRTTLTMVVIMVHVVYRQLATCNVEGSSQLTNMTAK